MVNSKKSNMMTYEMLVTLRLVLFVCMYIYGSFVEPIYTSYSFIILFTFIIDITLENWMITVSLVILYNILWMFFDLVRSFL